MTSPFAIAAITARVRNLLDQTLESEFPGIRVTALPLNLASENLPQDGRINLCLYEIEQNPQWRNGSIPWQARPGETGQPPLPLNLYYLLTAFHGPSLPASDDSLPTSQQLLGLAMSVLHDHPVFQPFEISAVLNGLSSNTPFLNRYNQIENMRITFEPLVLDSKLRLFESAQTPYAISVAYQVAVVLIQSQRPTRSPLPVLTIGQSDSGVRVVPSLVPPYPTLTSLEFPEEQMSIELDQTLTLEGHHLDGDDRTAIVQNLSRTETITVDPVESESSTELDILIAATGDPDNDWVAGFYTVAVALSREGKQQRTNELSFALAPRISAITLDPANPSAGDLVTLTIDCAPAIRADQQVFLLLGNLEIPMVPPGGFPASTVSFEFEAPDAGSYFVRLRVDGVNSLIITRSPATPEAPSRLIFNPDREVVIL